MDAYVLGTHKGDLPTHLLGDAGSGRVRAMGALEGAPHSIYVAVEGDTREALEDAVAIVTGAGIEAEVGLTLNPEAADSGNIIINLIHIPSRMPPWELLLFLWLEGELFADAIETAVEHLGPEGVAVASDGKGKVLIELGGNNAAKVEAAAAAITDRHKNVVVARVAGGLSHAK